MTKLFDMSDADLLAWAKDFINTECETTIAKTLTLKGRPGDFPANAIMKKYSYGFGRFFNDGLGGKEVPVADKVKAGRVKYNLALQGVVGRTRGEAVDPFMTIVMRVVRQAVKAKNADNYKKIIKGENPDAVFTAIFEKHRANDTPQYKNIMERATVIRKQQEELRDGPKVTLSVSTDDL